MSSVSSPVLVDVWVFEKCCGELRKIASERETNIETRREGDCRSVSLVTENPCKGRPRQSLPRRHHCTGKGPGPWLWCAKKKKTTSTGKVMENEWTVMKMNKNDEQKHATTEQSQSTFFWGGNPNLTRCPPGLQPPPAGNMVGNHPNISKRWITTLEIAWGLGGKKASTSTCPQGPGQGFSKDMMSGLSCQRSNHIKPCPIYPSTFVPIPSASFGYRIVIALAKQIHLFIPASETWSCMCTYHLCVYIEVSYTSLNCASEVAYMYCTVHLR